MRVALRDITPSRIKKWGVTVRSINQPLARVALATSRLLE